MLEGMIEGVQASFITIACAQVHPYTARPESPQFLPYDYAADVRNGGCLLAVCHLGLALHLSP